MALDPSVAALLEQMPPLDPALTVEQMRSQSAGQALLGAGNQQVASVDRTIPGPGGEIPVRFYTPATGSPPWGLVVFYHGGGWVICGLDTHDAICRDLAAGTETAVLSVDYRLAPEHPFPAAVDDAWAALQWASKHAGDLDVDPDRLAVAGDSAGGNLAAVMALMARDHGLALSLQLLVYPATDFSRRRPSVQENGHGYLLTETGMEWFEGHYAPDRSDWRASPMLASDHRGVAPAAVLTCEFDPLRDDGNDYAATLAAAGVPVTNRCYPGLIHGAFSMTSVIPPARAMMDDACAAVRQGLAPS
jgi:acetyl esterase